MALFEKKKVNKVLLDDTEPLQAIIENSHPVNNHTEYIIRVQRGPTAEKSWYVYKRFNDFVQLNTSFDNLPLPPKKFLGNMDRAFIAERLEGLQNYLNIILANPILANSHPFKRFLDPNNYSDAFHEIAMQYVSMAIRSESQYEIIRRLPELGWRLRKHYFLVRSKCNPKDEKLLYWVGFGPDKYIEDRDLQNLLKTISAVQHPYLCNPEYCALTENGVLAIRPFHAPGSLADLLYDTKPLISCARKYGKILKAVKPLPVNQVRLYGYQILDCLEFLHEKGIAYGHLHTRNIIVNDGHLHLLEVENSLFGLPSYYRHFCTQHKKINSSEAVDVYCFGHVLYEMAFGEPLLESSCDEFPADCPSVMRSVLSSILSSAALKNGLPSIAVLKSNPYFNVNGRCSPDRVYMKISSHLKQALRDSSDKTLERLQEQQKMISKQRRMVKIQEKLNSQDRKKKKTKLKTQSKPDSLDVASNGKASDRSDSPNSVSTANSSSSPPPGSSTVVSPSCPVPPPPMPPPPPPASLSNGHDTTCKDDGKSALLSAIRGFNKENLKATCSKGT